MHIFDFLIEPRTLFVAPTEHEAISKAVRISVNVSVPRQSSEIDVESTDAQPGDVRGGDALQEEQ
jgi:hypothetical protein